MVSSAPSVSSRGNGISSLLMPPESFLFRNRKALLPCVFGAMLSCAGEICDHNTEHIVPCVLVSACFLFSLTLFVSVSLFLSFSFFQRFHPHDDGRTRYTLPTLPAILSYVMRLWCFVACSKCLVWFAVLPSTKYVWWGSKRGFPWRVSLKCMSSTMLSLLHFLPLSGPLLFFLWMLSGYCASSPLHLLCSSL